MPNPPLAVWIPVLMNLVALLQCVLAATSFAEATVVKKNAKGAKELGSSTRSTRLKDLTPTVEKAACATAAASAPRIQTAAFGCFRCADNVRIKRKESNMDYIAKDAIKPRCLPVRRTTRYADSTPARLSLAMLDFTRNCHLLCAVAKWYN